MIDRRILLASVASLLGLAAFRWLRVSPAKAAEKFEVEKTDAEWRAQLTPQQYEILRKQGTERPGSSPLLKEHRKGISPAPVATCRCSPRRRNSRAAPAGRVFISRSRTPSARPKTGPTACCEPKSTAGAAADISVTSSTTGRNRPACATAWTASRWCFTPQHPRRPDRSLPGNCCPLGNCAPVLGPGLFL